MKENNENELARKMKEMGKQLVLKKLRKYHWNLEKTANDLRVTKEELLELMKRYGIKI